MYGNVFMFSLTHIVNITPSGKWMKKSGMLLSVSYLNHIFTPASTVPWLLDRHLADNLQLSLHKVPGAAPYWLVQCTAIRQVCISTHASEQTSSDTPRLQVRKEGSPWRSYNRNLKCPFETQLVLPPPRGCEWEGTSYLHVQNMVLISSVVSRLYYRP